MSTPRPTRRPRRLRRTSALRGLARDVRLHPSDLIQPLFVSDAEAPQPVPSMPGVAQLPVGDAVEHIQSLAARGLKSFLLFGVTPDDKKDASGSFACDPAAPVNRVLQTLRSAQRDDLVLIADTCFCEYTSHGHCGVLAADAAEPGSAVVDNDATLNELGRLAIAQADAGADIVAPSCMMDGQVAAIRSALDAAGHSDTAIMSYAVKFASSLYGPFRDAGGGGMQFGDRRAYQMDYARSREWRTELQADIDEGADIAMVKPAAAYLDIVHQVRAACDLPVAAYHVSGEYAMLHAAAERGWLDLAPAAVEVTTAIKRAGADLIITYFAADLLDWLQH